MTCSITDCLADILKLEVTYPPGRSGLAKIVACFPICRVQEAFKENIISASDSVRWSTSVCVCVCEQVMENEEGRKGWLSPMPENKTRNDSCRTEKPVEKLHNWKINRAERCMGSSLSLGFIHTTAHSGWQTLSEGHTCGKNGQSDARTCKNQPVTVCFEMQWLEMTQSMNNSEFSRFMSLSPNRNGNKHVPEHK